MFTGAGSLVVAPVACRVLGSCSGGLKDEASARRQFCDLSVIRWEVFS